MISPIIQFKWVDVSPSRDEFSQATMAELEIRVGDVFITSVLDQRTHGHREHVLVPLVQVAEWLVSHWWSIWYECENHGSPSQRVGFDLRHDLAFAGDGFVLPRLLVISSGDGMQLRSFRWKPDHAAVEFIGEQDRLVDQVELEVQFRGLIDAVIERLRQKGCSHDSLEREWEVINSLSVDEREFCKASALLGLDPFELDNGRANSIVSFWNSTASSLREDALAGADPESLDRVSEWLSDSLRSLEDGKSGPGWSRLRSDIMVLDATRPWERGFRLGQAVRKKMNSRDARFEFERSGKWGIQYTEGPTPSQRIQGIVSRRDPSCIVCQKAEAGKRFLLARALGDFISRKEDGAGMLTSLATVRQAESRSFAAEFLAPSALLQERIGRDPPFIDADKIDEFAREFGVSSYVIRHQIVNHKLGEIIEAA